MRFALVAVLLAGGLSDGLAQSPRRANALPNFDWQCFASVTAAFEPPGGKSPDIGLDGDNLKKPRFLLRTVDGHTLKIVESPENAAARKEHGKSASEITADFIGANPVFAWREEIPGQVRVFALNVDDKLLTVSAMTDSGWLKLNSVSTLKCSDLKRAPHASGINICGGGGFRLAPRVQQRLPFLRGVA